MLVAETPSPRNKLRIDLSSRRIVSASPEFKSRPGHRGEPMPFEGITELTESEFNAPTPATRSARSTRSTRSTGKAASRQSAATSSASKASSPLPSHPSTAASTSLSRLFDDMSPAALSEAQVAEFHAKSYTKTPTHMTTSDVDHIDMSGPSSPITRRSPIAPTTPTQSIRRRRVLSSDEDDVENIPPSRRKSRAHPPSDSVLDVYDSVDDEYVPRGKTPSTKRTTRARSRIRAVSVSSDEDVPLTRSRRKGKGKEKAPAPPESLDSFIVPDSPPPSHPSRSTASRSRSHSVSSDEYGDDNFDYGSVPFPHAATDIPDFSALPSTYPRRSPSPEIVVIDSDSDSAPETEIQPAARTSMNASVALLFQKEKDTHALFADLTLLPDMDERWRAFYTDHWRRGADAESDDDGAFGSVEAPAGAAKKAFAGRGGWRGRGRGRGRPRGGRR